MLQDPLDVGGNAFALSSVSSVGTKRTMGPGNTLSISRTVSKENKTVPTDRIAIRRQYEFIPTGATNAVTVSVTLVLAIPRGCASLGLIGGMVGDLQLITADPTDPSANLARIINGEG